MYTIANTAKSLKSKSAVWSEVEKKWRERSHTWWNTGRVMLLGFSWAAACRSLSGDSRGPVCQTLLPETAGQLSLGFGVITCSGLYRFFYFLQIFTNISFHELKHIHGKMSHNWSLYCEQQITDQPGGQVYRYHNKIRINSFAWKALRGVFHSLWTVNFK